MAALCAAILLSATPAFAAGWRQRIDEAIGKRSMGVSVRLDGALLYSHTDREKRVPASGQKLLMSMALLNKLDYRSRIPTLATIVKGTLENGIVTGDLWLLGRGDPTVTDSERYAKSLFFEPTWIGKLAKRIKAAGVKRITGRVMGSTGYYSHDWYATGWKPEFPVEEIPMPTALTYNGNRAGDFHFADPERRAAQALTRKLRDLGVRVKGPAEQADAPEQLRVLSKIRSRSLKVLLRFTNRQSSNFFAEVFGKRLGIEEYGRPGTISKGAQAIAAFAARRDVKLTAYDSSGLSYSNRVSPRGMAKLLSSVEGKSWVGALRETLAGGNQGTLKERLYNVKLRAKTGTLTKISTLSGWVWCKRVKKWCAFSIMSRGMDKSVAADVEDKIMRILTAAAH